jgi:hypothetical protein
MNFDEFTERMFGPRGDPRREEMERHADISRRTNTFLNALFGWTQRIPIVGRLTYSFWYSLFEHDHEHYVSLNLRNTLTPRWGAITFGFLNDGMRPTLWHTWQELVHHNGEYDGIWVPRAPRNKADAEAIRAFYAKRSGLAFTGGPAAILTTEEQS